MYYVQMNGRQLEIKSRHADLLDGDSLVTAINNRIRGKGYCGFRSNQGMVAMALGIIQTTYENDQLPTDNSSWIDLLSSFISSAVMDAIDSNENMPLSAMAELVRYVPMVIEAALDEGIELQDRLDEIAFVFVKQPHISAPEMVDKVKCIDEDEQWYVLVSLLEELPVRKENINAIRHIHRNKSEPLVTIGAVEQTFNGYAEDLDTDPGTSRGVTLAVFGLKETDR